MGLNDQLNQEIESLQQMMLAKRYLQTVKQKILQKTALLDRLSKHVEKEYRDVEALEKKSLSSIFSRILVDDQQQLEIERQEYLDAVLTYKDAARSIELLQFEEKILEEKIKEIPAKKDLIDTLIKLRTQKVETSSISNKSKFLAVSRDIDGYFRQKSEVHDAKIAGAKSKRSLLLVLDHLKKAALSLEWGFDSPLPYDAKSYVDAAIDQFYQLKVDLTKFEEELDDAHTPVELDLFQDLRQFNAFVDTYTNFLINDWVIRGKISNMISMMESLHDEILRLMSTLDRKQKQLEQSIEDAEFLKLSLKKV